MATEERLPRALKVPGGITEGYKIIHRRRVDNLPDHVKGSVTFHAFKDENDRFKPITGYYTNDDQKRVAVELLKDDVTILGLVGPLFFISLTPSFLINPSRPLSF